MKKFFANIWTKRVVSLLSAAYAFFMLLFAFLFYWCTFKCRCLPDDNRYFTYRTCCHALLKKADYNQNCQLCNTSCNAACSFVLFRRVVFDNTYCNNRYFDLSSFGSRRGNKNCIGNCIPSPLHFWFTWLFSCKLTFCYSN